MLLQQRERGLHARAVGQREHKAGAADRAIVEVRDLAHGDGQMCGAARREMKARGRENKREQRAARRQSSSRTCQRAAEQK